MDVASPLESSALDSWSFHILNLKSIYVNKFVLKNKERKKNHRIAHKNLQLYDHGALDLNQSVWCVGVLRRRLQAVLTRVPTLTPSWWSTSSRPSPSRHTDASSGCRRIQTTSRTLPGRRDTRASGAPTASCSGTAALASPIGRTGVSDYINNVNHVIVLFLAVIRLQHPRW